MRCEYGRAQHFRNDKQEFSNQVRALLTSQMRLTKGTSRHPCLERPKRWNTRRDRACWYSVYGRQTTPQSSLSRNLPLLTGEFLGVAVSHLPADGALSLRLLQRPGELLVRRPL